MNSIPRSFRFWICSWEHYARLCICSFLGAFTRIIKFHKMLFFCTYRSNDIWRIHSYVLHSWTPIVLNILLWVKKQTTLTKNGLNKSKSLHVFAKMHGTCLDLRLPLSQSRLIDGHFHRLLVVCHHNGAQRTEFRLKLLVIHRPETVKEEVPLIPENQRWVNGSDESYVQLWANRPRGAF